MYIAHTVPGRYPLYPQESSPVLGRRRRRQYTIRSLCLLPQWRKPNNREKIANFLHFDW